MRGLKALVIFMAILIVAGFVVLVIGLIQRSGELSADDLMRRYCTHVYARVGSYEEAARRLGLDRRTVKARIDSELLERLRS